MSLDFQQVQDQVRQLGENAPLRERQLQATRERAAELLTGYAGRLEYLQARVQRAVQHDPSLRCACPVDESLTAHFLAPGLPPLLTVLAADGSQINPDRHAPVEYCLINVGAIRMAYRETPDAPDSFVQSRLLYDEAVYDLTEERVALQRDLAERQVLAEVALQSEAPVLTFTDGPVELWGAKDEQGDGHFQKSLESYLESLKALEQASAIHAGYVDKPGADLVTRLLELAATPDDQLADVRHNRPFRGVTDIDLYHTLLAPGERSAVFAMQSKSAEKYTGRLGLGFFYLNVGREGEPWLARGETSAWVAEDPLKLEILHAGLVVKCRILGANPYPYLLHRAHEVAVVTQEEKEQLTQMIVIELRRRGVVVGEASKKQFHKDLPGRTRLKGK